MRGRFLFGLAAVLGLPLSPIAASTNLVSRPVGVCRITLQPHEQRLVSTPFWAFNGDDSINAVLKNQLTGASDETNGDVVLKFDSAIPGYLRAVRGDPSSVAALRERGTSPDAQWFDDLVAWKPSAMTLTCGEGWFVCNNKPYTQQLVICGEVALEPEETELTLPSGPSLLGFPYSSAGTLDGLDRNDPVTRADGQPAERNLNLGEGYWYLRKAMDSLTWRTTRPYSNPFPKNQDPPRVLSMTPTSDGSNIVLSIETAGAPSEKLDVYYQCLGPTNGFSAETGWSVAALDIEVGGVKEIQWQDETAGLDGVATVYLVGRSDLDLSEGIPECRRRFLSPEELARAMRNYAALKGRGLVSTKKLDGGNALAQNAVSARGSGRIVYVDRRFGHDGFSGRLSIVVINDGPKRSIRAGLAEAASGDTLVIRQGEYAEPLNVAGKGISVRIEGHVDLTEKK